MEASQDERHGEGPLNEMLCELSSGARLPLGRNSFAFLRRRRRGCFSALRPLYERRLLGSSSSSSARSYWRWSRAAPLSALEVEVEASAPLRSADCVR